MQKLPFFLFFAILLSFLSCNQTMDTIDKRTQHLKRLPESTSRIDEVLLVMEEDQWSGDLGESVRDVFMKAYGVMPNDQPLFDLRQVDGNGLVSLLKRSSTVIIVADLSTDNSTSDIVRKKMAQHPKTKNQPYFAIQNVWAKPQQIIYIVGKDATTLKQNLKKYEAKLIRQAYKVEDQKALRTIMVSGVDDGMSEYVRQKFKVDLDIPTHFQKIEEGKDFIWLRYDYDAAEQILNFMIHVEPYPAQQAPEITQEYALKTFRALGKHVESQVENSYLIPYDVLPYESQRWNMDNNLPALETRGLWRIHNDFMGGPFLLYTLDDPINHQLVTLAAFVYAPKSKNKRGLVRKLEQFLQTVDIVR